MNWYLVGGLAIGIFVVGVPMYVHYKKGDDNA